MSQNSKIEWTDATWNPIRGCSRVSQGCINCYAERQAARFAGPMVPYADAPIPGIPLKPTPPFEGFVRITNGHPQWTGKVELVEKHLEDPLHWRRPRRVFVNSMSDLFHEALPDEAIDRVFAVMALCPEHAFQVLTKRPERMLAYINERPYSFIHSAIKHLYPACDAVEFVRGARHRLVPWLRWPLSNVWLGVSVEDQATANERIPLLLQTPAALRFVSYEPALGPVEFTRIVMPDGDDLGTGLFNDGEDSGLNWVIVGGESGPGARPFDVQWARDTVAQCKAAGVACFVKQLGTLPIIESQELLGKTYDGKFVVGKCAGVNGNAVSVCLDDHKGGDWDEWPKDLRVRQFPEVPYFTPQDETVNGAKGRDRQ